MVSLTDVLNRTIVLTWTVCIASKHKTPDKNIAAIVVFSHWNFFSLHFRLSIVHADLNMEISGKKEHEIIVCYRSTYVKQLLLGWCMFQWDVVLLEFHRFIQVSPVELTRRLTNK